jgi:hypothetical protein
MLFVSNFAKRCIFWYCTVPVSAIELYLDVRSRIEDNARLFRDCARQGRYLQAAFSVSVHLCSVLVLCEERQVADSNRSSLLQHRTFS